MTRCKEFYDKWRRDPNWCEKCKSAVSQINSYLGFIDELESRGVPREFTLVNLPESAIRPLFTEKDPNIKEGAIVSVKNWLETGKNPITGEFKKKITSGEVKKIIRALKREDVQPQPIESKGKYGTIYVDPPWPYENQSTRAATSNHYESLSIKQICELRVDKKRVSDLAAEKCHLHLWTTNAFLYDTKEILKAWEFEYKGIMVWIKPQMGIGNYWRVSHEFLVLGVKGKLTFDNHSEMSWIRHDRLEHSEKPEAIRQRIERVSPPPRIELFARKRVEGWDAWGDQLPNIKEMRL